MMSGSTSVAVQEADSDSASSRPMAAVHGMGPVGSAGGRAGVSQPPRPIPSATSPAIAAAHAVGEPDQELNISPQRNISRQNTGLFPGPDVKAPPSTAHANPVRQARTGH